MINVNYDDPYWDTRWAAFVLQVEIDAAVIHDVVVETGCPFDVDQYIKEQLDAARQSGKF
jgi:hypothetical protein